MAVLSTNSPQQLEKWYLLFGVDSETEKWHWPWKAQIFFPKLNSSGACPLSMIFNVLITSQSINSSMNLEVSDVIIQQWSILKDWGFQKSWINTRTWMKHFQTSWLQSKIQFHNLKIKSNTEEHYLTSMDLRMCETIGSGNNEWPLMCHTLS